MTYVDIKKWHEKEEFSHIAMQLLRSTRGSLECLKLVIEALQGNFTNWPEDPKKAYKLMADIREAANEDRLKAKEKAIDKLAAAK
jgi:hypothetical protein